jgi:hypothetical protein
MGDGSGAQADFEAAKELDHGDAEESVKRDLK